MKELLSRLFSQPIIAFEILTATFFITLLTLALPLYVIQILNRYVTYGFEGTLITLTSGMLIAVFFQLGFRMLRTKMGAVINQAPNENLTKEFLTILSRSKAEALEQIPRTKVQEALNNIQIVQNGYEAQSLNAILDAPFSFLFIIAAYFLCPILAWIGFLGILVSLLIGWVTVKKSQHVSEDLQKATTAHRSLNMSAINAADTVRAFQADYFLFQRWEEDWQRISKLRQKLNDNKELSLSLTQSGSILISVMLYAVGATIVVKGDLSIGALIGTNILAARAYQNTSRFMQTNYLLARVKESIKELQLLRRLPLEPVQGTAISKYSGKLELRDLGFGYPRTRQFLFERVSLNIDSGKVLVVCGYSGSGKTTLAKLIMGLLEPVRGEILVDGVNLQQIASPWWRKQVIYLPEEPTFINTSIRNNLVFLNPGLDDTSLNNILRKAGLRSFLDKTQKGMETDILDNGRSLPLGIKKRLALARGLVSDGKLVVLDAPSENMDEQGAEDVYQVMNEMAHAGKTILVFSNDQKILKGASFILDLNKKPKPELRNVF